MMRTLRIFRKDAGCLWPQALVYVALAALAATRNPVQTPGFVAGVGVLGFVLVLAPVFAPVACWVLTVSLIHEERLIGHEQYWLTRPYSWKELVAAKALFLLVFVNLPLFVCQCAALVKAGLSPFEWLPALLWRQVFFSVFFVMPVVALAAVTRHLGQVVLAGIVMFVLLEVGSSVLIRNRYPDWGGFDWIRTCAAALVMAGGTATAVMLQYTRRRTALSRGVVAGAFVVVSFAAFCAPAWGGAFAIQKLFSRETPGSSAVRVSFDESRAGRRPMSYQSSGSDPDGVRLEIPIRVDNLPRGQLTGVDWTSVGIDGPNGAWRSGWLTFRAIHNLSHQEAWLTVFVSPEFYERSKDVPMRLWGALDVTLFRRVGTIALREVGETVVPGVGLCTGRRSYMQNSVEQTEVACYSPFQKVTFSPFDQDDLASFGASYAPFPTSAGFQPLDQVISWTFGESAPSAVLNLPVAHVQRAFESPALRLRDYRLRN